MKVLQGVRSSSPVVLAAFLVTSNKVRTFTTHYGSLAIPGIIAALPMTGEARRAKQMNNVPANLLTIRYNIGVGAGESGVRRRKKRR